MFRSGRRTPEIVEYLGKVLLFAMIGMLVVYCLKGATPLKYPYGLPEMIALGTVVALHLWKRSSFLSIGAGTAVYMVLVQLVFR